MPVTKKLWNFWVLFITGLIQGKTSADFTTSRTPSVSCWHIFRNIQVWSQHLYLMLERAANKKHFSRCREKMYILMAKLQLRNFWDQIFGILPFSILFCLLFFKFRFILWRIVVRMCSAVDSGRSKLQQLPNPKNFQDLNITKCYLGYKVWNVQTLFPEFQVRSTFIFLNNLCFPCRVNEKILLTKQMHHM